MQLRRTTFVVTQKCTLKCKLCLAFMPYYDNPVNTTQKEAEKIIDNYFRLVEKVGIFSVTGGEPLINPDLVPIMEYVLKYEEQIENSIDIVTNGTIMFSDELLDLLQNHRNKLRIILSDYGESLSTKIKAIENVLKEKEITYRVQNYAAGSDNWTYNGWVDFTDHSLKHFTENELIQQGKRCIFRQGHYWVINNGELHPCSRQFWRMHQGIIPIDEEWYIDLIRLENVEAGRERIRKLEDAVYLKSCAYCNGVYNGIERHRPAEQL